MAHTQQVTFCSKVKDKFPDFFSKKIVLDIGSLDINGNNQYLFDNCLYLGVDLAEGRNVDFVSEGHNFLLPNNSVDVVISSECFEHDQYYDLTLKNIVRMLKPGGLFLFTCATTGRPEHGTRRTTPEDAPFTQKNDVWCDYYKNLTEKDIRDVFDVNEIFEDFDFSLELETHDLYFWGIKKQTYHSRSDYSFLVHQNAIQRELSRVHEEAERLSEAVTSERLDKARLEIEKKALNVQYEYMEEEKSRLEVELKHLHVEIARVQIVVEQYREQLMVIYRSKSWLITKPIRVIGRIVRSLYKK